MSKLRAEAVCSARWSSPKGAGLYFSILLRPTIRRITGRLITFMAALAVGDACVKACALQTDIKWPNDLLSGERKICGILAEAIETPAGRAVIVGIGINLTENAYPPEIATSRLRWLRRRAGRLSASRYWRRCCDALSRWYALLEDAESDRCAWSSRSSYAIRQAGPGEQRRRGLAGNTCGVERDGALRLHPERRVKLVRAGDVTA